LGTRELCKQHPLKYSSSKQGKLQMVPTENHLEIPQSSDLQN
jgi:hypothetical protein